jgi:hypothetical protein
MRDGGGHNGGVADAGGFEDGDAFDVRVGNRLGNAALVRIELDRSGVGSNAAGEAYSFLNPCRKRLALCSYACHNAYIY